jgi:pyridoxamine 5'-phosphate oxidase
VGNLRRRDLEDDPFREFERWFGSACDADIDEPNAMSLSTSTATGKVSSRMVLLKLWDADGFVFFTNHESRKAREIAENAHVALLFYWQTLHRQIRIEGTATRVSMRESLTYFATRPRGSQLGAWCSAQSSVISSREMLQSKLEEIKRKFQNREVPLPSMWGGYRVVPDAMEFWQAGEDRLHDRFRYSRQADETWLLERLAP